MAEKRKKRMTTKPFFTGKKDCSTSQTAGQRFFQENARNFLFLRFFARNAMIRELKNGNSQSEGDFMRIMAIDYGDAHTGIAISDPTGFLAGFTTTIDAYRPEAVADRIAAMAGEYGVEELVLGHPINMDGTRGPRSEKARAMADLLRQATSLPVVLWDERRTTIDAHQILFNSGKNAKKRKKVVDAVAASLILEGYLTYKKSHG